MLTDLYPWVAPPLRRLTLWLADQACALDAYVDRWMRVIDPGETGWMDE